MHDVRTACKVLGAGIRIGGHITDNDLDTPRQGHYCKFLARRQVGLAHTRPPCRGCRSLEAAASRGLLVGGPAGPKVT